MDVGPAELVIVLVIALVLFGGKKLPELARSLGQAKNEFEKGTRGEEPESDEPVAEPKALAPEALELPASEADSSASTSSPDRS